MQTKTLINDYEKSVEELVKTFLFKNFDFDEAELSEFNYRKDVYWVGQEIGGVFEWADYFIRLDEAIIDLKRDMPKGTWIEYYNASLEHENDRINYNSWCMGLRFEHIAEWKAKRIAECKNCVKQAQEAIEIAIKEGSF